MATKWIDKIYKLLCDGFFPSGKSPDPERAKNSLQTSLLRIYGLKATDHFYERPKRILDALKIAFELKKSRNIRFEHLLSADPQTGIETLMLLSKRETNPDRRATEEDILAMILSDYLRVIEDLPQPVVEQTKTIAELFDTIFGTEQTATDVVLALNQVTPFASLTARQKAFRALRSTPNIDKIKILTNALIRVGAVNLLERACSRSLTKRKASLDQKKRYTLFDHMVAEIVGDHGSTILIRGAQKLIQAQSKFKQPHLSGQDKDRLLSELEGIYIPLAEAYHYNALAKSLKDLVFEAREPAAYQQFLQQGLTAAKACVPEPLRKHITDLVSAERIVTEFLEQEIRNRIPEKHRDNCVIEVRLKNLSDVRNKIANPKRLHARDFVGVRIIAKPDQSDTATDLITDAMEREALYDINRGLHQSLNSSSSTLKQFTYQCANQFAETGHPLSDWFCHIKEEDKKKKKRNGEDTARSDFFDDYVYEPRKTGYQALHDTWRFSDGTMDVPGVFELQIVGHEMRKRNEFGDARHSIYAGDRREIVAIDPLSAGNNVTFFAHDAVHHKFDNEILSSPKGVNVLNFLAQDPEIFFSAAHVMLKRLPDSLNPVETTGSWADLLSSGDRIVVERDIALLNSFESRQNRLEAWKNKIPPLLLDQLQKRHLQLPLKPETPHVSQAPGTHLP